MPFYSAHPVGVGVGVIELLRLRGSRSGRVETKNIAEAEGIKWDERRWQEKWTNGNENRNDHENGNENRNDNENVNGMREEERKCSEIHKRIESVDKYHQIDILILLSH